MNTLAAPGSPELNDTEAQIRDLELELCEGDPTKVLILAAEAVPKDFLEGEVIMGRLPHRQFFGDKGWADWLDARHFSRKYGDKPLTIDFIIELHDHMVPKTSPDRPHLEDRTIEELAAICDEYNENRARDQDPYATAARLQRRFIFLHPFSHVDDGQTSLLLMNWALENRGMTSSAPENFYDVFLSTEEEWAQKVWEGGLRISNMHIDLEEGVNDPAMLLGVWQERRYYQETQDLDQLLVPIPDGKPDPEAYQRFMQALHMGVRGIRLGPAITVQGKVQHWNLSLDVNMEGPFYGTASPQLDLPLVAEKIYETSYPRTTARRYDEGEDGLQVVHLFRDKVPHGLLLIGTPYHHHSLDRHNLQVVELVKKWFEWPSQTPAVVTEGGIYTDYLNMDLTASVEKFGEAGIVSYFKKRYGVTKTISPEPPRNGALVMKEFREQHPELGITVNDEVAYLALRCIRQWCDLQEETKTSGNSAPPLKEYLLDLVLRSYATLNPTANDRNIIFTYDDLIATAWERLADYEGESFFHYDDSGALTFNHGEPGTDHFEAFKRFFEYHTILRDLPPESERSIIQHVTAGFNEGRRTEFARKIGGLVREFLSPLFIAHRGHIGYVAGEVTKQLMTTALIFGTHSV